MNADFDIGAALLQSPGKIDLPGVMNVMKESSAGKWTIQALADKIQLHRMIRNLGVPQLPVLVAVEERLEPGILEGMVRDHLCGPHVKELVLKPTHQSSGSGVLLLGRTRPCEIDEVVNQLTVHVESFLGQRAAENESAALRSLRPGFIAQPKYKSCVGFQSPLELRVLVLFGKAHVGLWWWGRNKTTGECPQRNTWFVRRPAKRGELGENDVWEPVHQHSGHNPGFEKALQLFSRHIQEIVGHAEKIAKAFGAPFLRADFFVGCPKRGVVLNEVAYGDGCDYRSFARDDRRRIVDDGPFIAQILQEGASLCQSRLGPEAFLSLVGVRGKSYDTMSVIDDAPEPGTFRADAPCPRCPDAVPDELCRTFRDPAVPAIVMAPSPPIPSRRICLSSRASHRALAAAFA